MKYRVGTESGTVYLLDTDAKVMIRQPSEDADPLTDDNEPMRYDEMLYGPEVGAPMTIRWGRKLRVTTEVAFVHEVE